MQTDEKLKKRITYEKMLANLSERAVSVEEVDSFLDSPLKSMGGILDVSRKILGLFHKGDDTISQSEYRAVHFLKMYGRACYLGKCK